ncbi:MAG TPA: hypothetical protein VJ841_05010 [Candidatus Saccharimonadales bacterium]|nr:hypothetical protein [Candidatus Saccharimonadales bacterium]
MSLKVLTDFLAALLEQRGQAKDETVQAAELCLSGLLTWIAQHPRRPVEMIEKIALSQLL